MLYYRGLHLYGPRLPERSDKEKVLNKLVSKTGKPKVSPLSPKSKPLLIKPNFTDVQPIKS